MRRSPSIPNLSELRRRLENFGSDAFKTVFPSKVNMNKVSRAFRIYLGKLPATNNIALTPEETKEYNKLVAKDKAQKRFDGNWQIVQQQRAQAQRAQRVVGPSPNKENINGVPPSANSNLDYLSADVIKGLTSEEKDEIVHLAINMQNLDKAVIALSPKVGHIAAEVAHRIHERKQRQQNRGPPAAGPANSNELLHQLVQRTQERKKQEQKKIKQEMVKKEARLAKGRIEQLYRIINKELERIHKEISNENLKQAQIRKLNDLYGEQYRKLHTIMSMGKAINTAGYSGRGPLTEIMKRKLDLLRSRNRVTQLNRIRKNTKKRVQIKQQEKKAEQKKEKERREKIWKEKLEKAKRKGREPPTL